MGNLDSLGKSEVIQPTEKVGFSVGNNYKKQGEKESFRILDINSKEKLDKDTSLSEEIILQIVDKLSALKFDRDVYNETLSKIIEFNKENFLGMDVIEGIISENKEEQKVIEREEEVNKEEEEKLLHIKESLSSLNLESYGDGVKTLREYLDNGEYSKVISILKDPSTFKSIADGLGGKGDDKYKEFKSSIISFDSSFQQYFEDYENITPNESGEVKSLTVDKVIEGVEENGGGIIDIDLKNSPPVSNMRMIGSEYGFKKKIDSYKLAEITSGSRGELNNLKKHGFDVVNNFDKGLSSLKIDIQNDEQGDVSGLISDFANTGLTEMYQMYEEFSVPNELRIQSTDFDLAINNPEDITRVINNVQRKTEKMKVYIGEIQAGILKQYDEDIKKLVKLDRAKEKKQLETLKFLSSIGFDLIPKSVTDQIVKMINIDKGLVDTGGLALNSDIDLVNGKFGYEDTDTDDMSSKEKETFIRLFNMMLNGKPEGIVSLGIAEGTTTLSPEDRIAIKRSGLLSVGGANVGYERVMWGE